MASEYQDKQQKKQDSGGTSLGQSLSSKTGTTSAGGGYNAYGGNTAKQYAARVNQIASDSALKYDPSDAVTGARNYLDEVVANKPGEYQGKYTGQINRLYDRIMNREKISYNQNSDAMYQQYAQMYRNAGLRGMRDANAQAAAQTGGYGNSYAQTAGQAQYNSAMTQLAQQVPTLQANAMDRYNTDMQNDANLYQTAVNADQMDYSRYNDMYSRWSNERDWAASEYDRQYGNDYNNWSNSVGMANNIVGLERDDAKQEMANAQNLVQTMISAGVTPSAQLVQKAGWDMDGVKKLIKK